MKKWMGIDYGSKMAGTTAIAFEVDDQLIFEHSEKKKDADKWLLKKIDQYKPDMIFIDAPLSLPNAFYKKGDNYFYRQCDVLTKAMSPMFLGGLTARAIKLKDQLNEMEWIETYPGFLIREILGLKDIYNKKEKINQEMTQLLIKEFDISLESEPQNWHQLDALACWVSGYRYARNMHKVMGDKSEGVIIV